ncbi:hypothetical protein KEM48_006265 [Puccinia striiformis f. sp. tritici PST-130]|nr:hypothetical protein KEM48_006265 [Puccinia striiformis f. sp. tritici PST-130]
MSIRSSLSLSCLIIGSLCLFGSKINAGCAFERPRRKCKNKCCVCAFEGPRRKCKYKCCVCAFEGPRRNCKFYNRHTPFGQGDLRPLRRPCSHESESVSMGPQLRRLLALNPTKGGRRPHRVGLAPSISRYFTQGGSGCAESKTRLPSFNSGK